MDEENCSLNSLHAEIIRSKSFCKKLLKRRFKQTVTVHLKEICIA